MKKRLMVLFMVFTVLFALVPTTNAYAEIGGVNKENYEDKYRYSVLNLHWEYIDRVTMYDQSGNSYYVDYYYNSPSSAFYIGNGYFATAGHCVKDYTGKEHKSDDYSVSAKKKVEVVTSEKDKQKYVIECYIEGSDDIELELVAYNKEDDVAILKVKDGEIDLKGLTPIKIADDYENVAGLKVYNVGWPGGDKYEYKEYGIYFREGVNMGYEGTDTVYIPDTFKLDSYAIGGQSGSPIMNEKNEVIGIMSCSNPLYANATSAEGLIDLLKTIKDDKALALVPSKYRTSENVITASNQN